MARDPYEVLGVSRDATDADIKAAYRKLAKKHHPDLNPGNKDADSKFKELNAANDLISDQEKRDAFSRGEADIEAHQRYQQQHQQQQRTYRDYAEQPQESRYNFNGGDFNLSDLESMFSGFGGSGAGPKSQSADVSYSIEVDFLEAARGGKKRVTMPDGKTLDITIPAGMGEGQKMRLKGQGASPSGDAYVEVHIRPHEFFIRNGRDITIELPIALQESVLGEKIQVPTIHGFVAMTIPKGASSSKTLRIKGKGVQGGDQYVKLKIVMPDTIDEELDQAIRAWSANHAYNPRKSMEKAS